MSPNEGAHWKIRGVVLSLKEDISPKNKNKSALY